MAEAEKKALAARLALQRSEMTNSHDSLRAELSVSKQLKKSVQNNPTRWMVGGAVSAIAFCFLFRRKKIIYSNFKRKRGLIGKSIRLAFFFVRPSLARFALEHAKDYAEDRLAPLPPNSMLGDPPQK